MLINKLLRSAITFLFLFYVSVCFSKQVSNLDSSYTVVQDRSSLARKEALQACFQNVILKNSGTNEALNNEVIQKHIANPKNFLIKYGYEQNNSRLVLTCRFNLLRIHRLLQENNLPIWGSQRPLTTLWLTIESGTGTSVVSTRNHHSIRGEVRNFSKVRGLDFDFPKSQALGKEKVSIVDLKEGFVQNIAEASLDYKSDFFAVANLTELGKFWTYELTLYSRQSLKSGDHDFVLRRHGQAATKSEVVQELIENINLYYVDRYATTDQGRNTRVFLEFNKISNPKMIMKIKKFFKKQSIIASSKIVKMSSSSAIFLLEIQGSESELDRVLKLERNIIREKGFSEFQYAYENDGIERRDVPVYRWKN